MIFSYIIVGIITVLYSKIANVNAENGTIIINKVQIYHFVVRHWVNIVYEGDQQCGSNLQCEWTWAENMHRLHMDFENYRRHGSFTDDHALNRIEPGVIVNDSVSATVYNIHSLWEKKREHSPLVCELRTNMTLAESEESRVRYGHLFEPSFKNFDGYSTTSPLANVQRIYRESLMNVSDFFPLRPFPTMIKGASYVASDCHARDGANAGRDGVVIDIRRAGFRVDGLGRCLRSPVGPEGIELPKDRATRYNLELKRSVISNFMFNMAFENSLEPGYVTEKPFDALMAGTVPVYLGDAAHLKTLVPYPKAIIYLQDMNNNVSKLVEYLTYLTTNETAYEEHREWRRHYSLTTLKKHISLMGTTWPCAVCKWVLNNSHLHHKRIRHCKDATNGNPPEEVRDVSKYNGKAIRGNGREVYLVQNGALRPIPDLNTLFSLNISLKSILLVPEKDFNSMKIIAPIPKAEREFPEV